MGRARAAGCREQNDEDDLAVLGIHWARAPEGTVERYSGPEGPSPDGG